MPTASKGARLYFRNGKGNEKSVWVIRDGEKSERTGCGADEREAAEQRLAAYIVEKHKPSRDADRDPSQISVADVINIYMEDKAPHTARPKEVGQRLAQILGFFGGKMLSQVNGPLCAAYVRKRKSKAAARRELEDLRAAIRYHWTEGLCRYETKVVLPGKSAPRERWLTRNEAARLLWVSLGWSLKPGKDRQGNDALVLNARDKQNTRKRRHLARFVLVGLYTGTRATAICQASLVPKEGRGFIDVDAGIFQRRPIGAKETKKRRPPIRLQDNRLLVHLRRWRALGLCRNAVVEWKGKPITRMAKTFRTAASDAGFTDVTPHILRHTAITWAMQNGAEKYDTSDYFGVSLQVLEDVYAHHNPEHGAGVNRAIGSKKKPQPVRHPVRKPEPEDTK